jgi:hypothetical protein
MQVVIGSKFLSATFEIAFSAGCRLKFRIISIAFCSIFVFASKMHPLYRQIAAISLMTAFLVQTFGKNLILLDYLSHTAKYNKFCENKARPAMHCNGKCQMMKKLQQEANKDKQYPDRKPENKNENISSKSSFPILCLGSVAAILKKPFDSRSYPKAIDRSFGIFHPPQS